MFSMFNNPMNAVEMPTQDYKDAIISQAVQRPALVREYQDRVSGHTVKVFEPARAQGAYFGLVRESRRNSRKGAE